MNTLSSKMKINPKYQDLVSFKSKEEEIEHAAQMISFRILSEIEKYCFEREIKKKDLAEMMGTSRSYITQLFRGTKQINTVFLAKFEEAFKIKFDFSNIIIDSKSNIKNINASKSKKIKSRIAV